VRRAVQRGRNNFESGAFNHSATLPRLGFFWPDRPENLGELRIDRSRPRHPRPKSNRLPSPAGKRKSASGQTRTEKPGDSPQPRRPATPPCHAPQPRSTLHAPRTAHPGPHTMLCAAVPGPNNGFLAMLCRGTGSSCSGGGSGRLGIPGLGSAGPDLRLQGSSGKERPSRCARGKVLIASSARSGRIPLPPVVPEASNHPPIVDSRLSPPRSRAWMIASHSAGIPNSEIVP
jgi:hypothetical protein